MSIIIIINRLRPFSERGITDTIYSNLMHLKEILENRRIKFRHMYRIIRLEMESICMPWDPTAVMLRIIM